MIRNLVGLRRSVFGATTFAPILFLVAAGLYAGSTFARFTPAPLPTPDFQFLTSGSVEVVARQSNGGLVVGGGFISIAGEPRQLARINPDGSLDASWNPNPDGAVLAIAVDAADAVYVVGDFSQVGGQARSRMAKLGGSGTGAADPNWDSPLANPGSCVALDSSGVYVGCASYLGLDGKGLAIAKLSLTTGAYDSLWSPAADNSVSAIAADGAGSLYVSGTFSNIGGQSRGGLAKLSTSGSGLADATWNPSPNGAVTTLLADAAGVYVGGSFSMIGGQSRANIARLGTSGAGNADGWNPSASATVRQLALDPSQGLYVGGDFLSIGGQTRFFVARLSTSTGLADSWSAIFSEDNHNLYSVNVLAVGANNVLVVGGPFRYAAGARRLGFAELTAAGTANSVIADTKTYGVAGPVVAAQDGGAFIAGNFIEIDGTPRNGLARLLPDLTLDPNWNPAPDGDVYMLAVDTVSNALYVGGVFYNIGGQARNRLAKVDAGGSGAADAVWNPSPAGSVKAIAVDGSGGVFVGGYFTAIGGQSRKYIAKVSGSAGGSADPTWNPNPDSYVYNLAVDDSDGAVYAAGNFSAIGGQSRHRLAKLSSSATGAADASWAPEPDGIVNAIAVGSDSVFVGGNFSSIGQQFRQYVAKLAKSGSGSADANWQLSVQQYPVVALALDDAGSLYGPVGYCGVSPAFLPRISPVSGTTDANWTLSLQDFISGIAVTRHRILISGTIYAVNGHPRRGLVAAVGDITFTTGFEQEPGC